MPGSRTNSHSHPHSRTPGLRSVKKTFKPVNFACLAPGAKRVTLVGDFNDWHPDALPLKRQIDGTWSVQVTLGHGHHHYQFLVDGKPTLDPRAQGIARNEANEKVSLVAVS
jgi:1,4-alpha-glucan branching enzyme